jgi:hypothetical protein
MAWFRQLRKFCCEARDLQKRQRDVVLSGYSEQILGIYSRWSDCWPNPRMGAFTCFRGYLRCPACRDDGNSRWNRSRNSSPICDERRCEVRQAGPLAESAEILAGSVHRTLCALVQQLPDRLVHVLVARHSVFTSAVRRPSIPTQQSLPLHLHESTRVPIERINEVDFFRAILAFRRDHTLH